MCIFSAILAHVFCLLVKLQLHYDHSYSVFIQICLESSRRSRWAGSYCISLQYRSCLV